MKEAGEKVLVETADEEKNQAEDALQQVRDLTRQVRQALEQKSPEAGKLFDGLSKMAVDTATPPHFQALGRVLRAYMSGVRTLDMDGLPEKFARVVREVLEG